MLVAPCSAVAHVPSVVQPCTVTITTVTIRTVTIRTVTITTVTITVTIMTITTVTTTAATMKTHKDRNMSSHGNEDEHDDKDDGGSFDVNAKKFRTY